jgi:hypothetical protein
MRKAIKLIIKIMIALFGEALNKNATKIISKVRNKNRDLTNPLYTISFIDAV